MLDRAQLTAAAGVDPWAMQAQVAAGDPDEIERLAAAFYRAAGHTAEASAADGKAREYARAGYAVGGGSPVDYAAEASRTSASLRNAADALPKVATLLAGVADDLATARRDTDSEVSALQADLDRIEGDSQRFMQTTGHHLPPDDRDAVRAGYVGRAVDATRIRGAAVGATVDRYEASLASATRSMAALGYDPPAALDEAPPPPTPPVGSDPTIVARWWAGLTPGERQALLTGDYTTLGQMRGLPAAALDTANRHRLADHIAVLRQQLREPGLGPEERAALQHDLDQDLGVQRAADQAGPGNPRAPVLLLGYDPVGHDGQTGAEIAFGNPDTATDTAVVVPGTGSNATNLLPHSGDALALYRSMQSPSKAVVMWLDGAEPQSLAPDAALDHWGEDSTQPLVADLAGLTAAHASATAGADGHLTAIGHSYGSYILGRALNHGAAVDDAVFIGSPGVGVNHASDLGVDAQHVWSGQAGDDPILLVAKRFTPDPGTGYNPEESDFGAQHFNVDGSHGHSQYYQGESLQNMANIASGDYYAVDRTSAPDYRGPRELPGDIAATTLDPIDGTVHTIDDAVHGHPIKAAEDVADSVAKTAKDGFHTVEDGVQTVIDVGEKLTSWIP